MSFQTDNHYAIRNADWLDFDKLKLDPVFVAESLSIDLAVGFTDRMDELGVSAQDVAKQTQLHEEDVNRVLSGDGETPLSVFCVIAAHLGLRIKTPQLELSS